MRDTAVVKKRQPCRASASDSSLTGPPHASLVAQPGDRRRLAVGGSTGACLRGALRTTNRAWMHEPFAMPVTRTTQRRLPRCVRPDAGRRPFLQVCGRLSGRPAGRRSRGDPDRRLRRHLCSRNCRARASTRLWAGGDVGCDPSRRRCRPRHRRSPGVEMTAQPLPAHGLRRGMSVHGVRA